MHFNSIIVRNCTNLLRWEGNIMVYNHFKRLSHIVCKVEKKKVKLNQGVKYNRDVDLQPMLIVEHVCELFASWLNTELSLVLSLLLKHVFFLSTANRD